MSDTQAPTVPAAKGTWEERRKAERAAEEPFVQRIQALDRGRLAVLRRNAGNTWAESRGVSWFYGVLYGAVEDGDHRWQLDIYFLVATLMALKEKPLPGDQGLDVRPFSGNFGQTMRALSQKPHVSAEAVERRFRVLLDAQFDSSEGRPAGGEMAFRLRQLVKLARAHDIGVDWPRLLVDLRRWGFANKPSQRQWAESYYGPSPEPAPSMP